METLPPLDEMRRAYLAGDRAYEGLFVLGVKTTGIFCRPTCPARKPLPRNVEFFADAKAALAAGYRPCKRCRPAAIDDQPAWADRLLADLERDPGLRLTDHDLKARGVDPATVRRYFRSRYGMTFQAFARARRLSNALHAIREGTTIDDAVFESGYESHSGFREAFARAFGSPPGEAAGRDCLLFTWLRTPLGPMVAAATAEGLGLLEFVDRDRLEGQLKTLSTRFGLPAVAGRNPHLDRLEAELAAYFEGHLREFTVPLISPGTPFQQRVWAELRRIPYGEVRSYEDIAAAIGSPKAVRAVGLANGRNRNAIVIPCHRVVNKGGKLGGYAGGLARKQFLLDLERGRRSPAVGG